MFSYRPTQPRTGNPETDRAIVQVNDALQDAFRQIAQCPFIDGGVRLDVDVGTSDTVIEHKLGTNPMGWIVIDARTAGASLQRVAWDEYTITLVAAVPFTGTIWIF